VTAAGLPYICKHVSCNEQWLFSGDEQAVLIVLELNPKNKTSRNKKSLEQSPGILPFFPEANFLFFTIVFPLRKFKIKQSFPVTTVSKKVFPLTTSFCLAFVKTTLTMGCDVGIDQCLWISVGHSQQQYTGAIFSLQRIRRPFLKIPEEFLGLEGIFSRQFVKDSWEFFCAKFSILQSFNFFFSLEEFY